MEQYPNLESLYQEAQDALATKDFERARGLLKQILLVDENYKDASKLLAGLVEQQRRRWYQSRWLWGSLGGVAIVTLSIVLAGRLPSRPPAPTQPPIPTSQTPTSSSMIPSPTPSAMPTSIPLVWERLWMGEELARDDITTIVVDPTDSDILYVGTQNAGIYKSIDGGISWKPVHNGLGRAWVISLLIDPVNPRTLYAGVSTGGVYKTLDGGGNWFAVNEGIDRVGVLGFGSLTLDPLNNQHLLFTSQDGLLETINGGKNWYWIQEGYPSDCFVNIQFDPSGSGSLYAILSSNPSKCGGGGIFKSEDDGQTWDLMGLNGIEIDNWQHQILAINPSNGKLLYTSTISGIYASRDGGGTWQLLKDMECGSLEISPSDGDILYCGGGGYIAKTTDGGIIWTIYKTPGTSWGPWRAIALMPHDPQYILLGAQGMILSTDGGETWEERSRGLGAGLIELTLDPSDDSVIYLEQRVNGSLYRSMDRGQSWVLMNDQGKDLALDRSGEFLYRLEMKEGLLRSRDQGQSWEVTPWPLNAFPKAIAAHPRQSQLVYVTYCREYPADLFLSKDGGENWEGTRGIESICDGRLYFDHQDGNVVYIIGDGGVLDIFRSKDSGQTWGRCEQAARWYSGSYSRLVVDPRDSDHLILATLGEGVKVSEDGCQSWQSSNTGLRSMFVNTVAYDPNDPDTLYAGGDSGAYVSFNGGETWGQINDGLLGATIVYSIIVDSESNVYAATPYGVFELESK